MGKLVGENLRFKSSELQALLLQDIGFCLVLPVAH